MELRERFNSQWHGIRDAVLSEAKRELALRGRVDVELLTAKLHEETRRWQSGELSQGLWYKEFLVEDPEGASSFAEKAQNARIYEPANNKKPSNGWIYFLFIVMAFILGIVLHSQTELNAIEQIFYPILFFIIAETLYVPVKNNREKKYVDRITEDLTLQLDVTRQELANFIK